MRKYPIKLTRCLEDYLEMVHVLNQTYGIARVKDVTAALQVKMPSVAKVILGLKKIGLVAKKSYRGVEYTEAGIKMALSVRGRHVLLKRLLIHFGVSKTVAEKDAYSMGHVVSAETISKVENFRVSPELKI